jgi:hypothetical protein
MKKWILTRGCAQQNPGRPIRPTRGCLDGPPHLLCRDASDNFVKYSGDNRKDSFGNPRIELYFSISEDQFKTTAKGDAFGSSTFVLIKNLWPSALTS